MLWTKSAVIGILFICFKLTIESKNIELFCTQFNSCMWTVCTHLVTLLFFIRSGNHKFYIEFLRLPTWTAIIYNNPVLAIHTLPCQLWFNFFLPLLTFCSHSLLITRCKLYIYLRFASESFRHLGIVLSFLKLNNV
jgi:hypothetical protein